MDLHLRWLTTENFKITKHGKVMKSKILRSKNKFKAQKNNKLRWLATDINLNCYTLGVLSPMLFLCKGRFWPGSHNTYNVLFGSIWSDVTILVSGIAFVK